MNIWKVGIIGGGPSGITAAIQLTRYGIPTILIEGQKLGGLLRNANWVENYPGFPNGISGEDLSDLMVSQMKNVGVNVVSDTIQMVDWDREYFVLQTHSEPIICELLIIASGTQATHLPQEVIHPSAEKFIFYEISQLPPLMQRQIAIIGGGDAAFDYALHLCRQNQVVIYQRKPMARCLPLLWQRANLSTNIKIHSEMNVIMIRRLESGKLELTLERRGEKIIQYSDYILAAIGRHPALGFLSPNLLAHVDELERDKLCYRVGDVKNGFFRQTAIAIGDGMKAAMQIAQSIKEVGS